MQQTFYMGVRTANLYDPLPGLATTAACAIMLGVGLPQHLENNPSHELAAVSGWCRSVCHVA